MLTLLFVLIYFPCVAVLGVIIRELGKGFGWLLVTYMTVLGQVVATLFYQVTLGREPLWIAIPVCIIVAIYFIFRWLGQHYFSGTVAMSDYLAKKTAWAIWYCLFGCGLAGS